MYEGLTVGELIEVLKGYDQNLEVWTEYDASYYHSVDISEVEHDGKIVLLIG